MTSLSRRSRLVCSSRRDYLARLGGIKTATGRITVYYPFALVALKEFAQSDDYEETGDLLLIFDDADGAQVTLKVRESVITELIERLARPPDRH